MNDFSWPHNGLAEMYTEAKATGKWFHLAYQNLWFSPDELKANMAEGRFRYGPVNWRLADPEEHRRFLESAVKEAVANLAEFAARMLKEGRPRA